VTSTPQAVRRATPRTRRPAKKTATPVDPTAGLLPAAEPVRLLDPAGTPVPAPTDLALPEGELLREMYRRMVVGRRFDAQATALTKQGRLAVYPSARGQEACQVAPMLALRDTDWVFPTYRESMALVTGVAHGETLQGRDTVAFVYIGDGATSEGDFHEGVNFAAVFKAPVVYLVQNNKYAISVPLSRQTAAPTLAYKGIGYGVPSEQVDGNDPAAVLAVLTRAVAHARAGHGPYLVEAHTYRMEAHTNADDATRYRDGSEVEQWRERDPVARLEAYLRSVDLLDDAAVAAVAAEGEEYAARLRDRMNDTPTVDPMSLFEHVYAEPTPQLVEQRDQVRAELAAARADAEGEH
jgi:pyruvate dehydrogenase E1 component alpha subunit